MARKLETKVPTSQRTKEGFRLFKLRKHQGWTQNEMAVQFGVSIDSVVKWEMGTRNMSGSALKLLEILEKQFKSGE